MQDKRAPLSSPAPVHPVREETINNLDGASFLSDATPANSAHPSRSSGAFSDAIPGKDGVPDVPTIPDAHAAQGVAGPAPENSISEGSKDPPSPQTNANPRDSALAPQVNANPRDSSLAPQVASDPRDSAHAPEASVDMSAQRKPSDVALPRSPTVTNPVNPIASSLNPPPPPPGELQGSEVERSKNLDAPAGFAELSAVPKGEEEDEPVMFAASYPGMEWMPTWEE